LGCDVLEFFRCRSKLERSRSWAFGEFVEQVYRPGEIFALTWGQISDHANIRQRVYRGIIDSPKTVQSERKAALSQGLLEDLASWKKKAVDVSDEAYVFPSERLTPLAMENVWRRNIGTRLDKAGLGWVNFQVMRRTSSSLFARPWC
jgi:integrase